MTKKLKTLVHWTGSMAMLFFLAGCEQKIAVESVVHPDGKVERTIILSELDSAGINGNPFGIDETKGWEKSVESTIARSTKNVKRTEREKYSVKLRKVFPSTTELNQEMNADNDSVFRIRSTFEKKFRWFYSYIKYADTYIQLNRFRYSPSENYFTREDHAFISRMPAEGSSITAADSVFLDNLTERLGSYYARGLFEEHYSIFMDAARKNDVSRNWLDSLTAYKGAMFSIIIKDEGNNDTMEDAFMIPLIRRMNPNFPVDQLADDYRKQFKAIKPRMEFMSDMAGTTKFTHHIRMPWKVISSNADSVNGNSLFWKPMALKFMLKDYTMEAESRQMNYWAVIVSAVIILLTVWLFMRRRNP